MKSMQDWLEEISTLPGNGYLTMMAAIVAYELGFDGDENKALEAASAAIAKIDKVKGELLSRELIDAYEQLTYMD